MTFFEQIYTDQTFRNFLKTKLFTTDKDIYDDMVEDVYTLILQKVNPSDFDEYTQYKNFAAMVARNSLSSTGNINRDYVRNFNYLNRGKEINITNYHKYDYNKTDNRGNRTIYDEGLCPADEG